MHATKDSMWRKILKKFMFLDRSKQSLSKSTRRAWLYYTPTHAGLYRPVPLCCLLLQGWDETSSCSSSSFKKKKSSSVAWTHVTLFLAAISAHRRIWRTSRARAPTAVSEHSYTRLWRWDGDAFSARLPGHGSKDVRRRRPVLAASCGWHSKVSSAGGWCPPEFWWETSGTDLIIWWTDADVRAKRQNVSAFLGVCNFSGRPAGPRCRISLPLAQHGAFRAPPATDGGRRRAGWRKRTRGRNCR